MSMEGKQELQRIALYDPKTGMSATVSVTQQIIESMNALAKQYPEKSNWDLFDMALMQQK